MNEAFEQSSRSLMDSGEECYYDYEETRSIV
jgi:hypothetical protein